MENRVSGIPERGEKRETQTPDMDQGIKSNPDGSVSDHILRHEVQISCVVWLARAVAFQRRVDYSKGVTPQTVRYLSTQIAGFGKQGHRPRYDGIFRRRAHDRVAKDLLDEVVIKLSRFSCSIDQREFDVLQNICVITDHSSFFSVLYFQRSTQRDCCLGTASSLFGISLELFAAFIGLD